MSNNNLITILDLLKEYEVIIPIIQRDYAQGREENKNIRTKFIDELYKYVTDAINASNKNESIKRLKLDFVYGNIKNDKFYPLDGQQRLTTLWLFYFYISYMTNKLEDNRDILKKFTYETRDSSSEFCKNLIMLQPCKDNNIKNNFSHEIKEQLWFFDEWDNDPTVKSMLVVLDAIHEKFKNEQQGENSYLSKLYELLFENNDVIFFYKLEIEHIELPDDLYVKMNARGKPLTRFENFKADFIDYLEQKDEKAVKEVKDNEVKDNEVKDNEVKDNEVKAVKKVKDNIDGKWADIFWQYKHKKYFRFDEIFMAFINRIFFGFATEIIKDDKSFLITKDFFNGKNEEYEEKALYDYIYDDDKISDDDIDSHIGVYREILDKNPSFINRFIKILNSLCELSDTDFFNLIKSPYEKDAGDDDDKKISFIPSYVYPKEDEKVSILGIKNNYRPVFYGICLYLENCNGKENYNEEKFKRWMRVIWNFCSLSLLDNNEDILEMMHLFHDLLGDSLDIDDALNRKSDIKINETSNILKNKFLEEREKSKKNLESTILKEQIEEMENYAFFKGTIGFLFFNDNNEADWSCFDTRRKHAQKLFSNETVVDNVKYKTYMAATLLHNTRDYNNCIYKKSIFSPKAKYWEKFLNEDCFKTAVHKILDRDFDSLDDNKFCSLMKEDSEKIKQDREKSNETKSKNFEYVEDILNNIPLVKYLVEKHPEYFWKDFHKSYCLYEEKKAGDKIIIDGRYKRNCMLRSLINAGEITIDAQNAIPGCDSFFLGERICFEYKEKTFVWETNPKPGYKEDKIYLLKSKDELKDASWFKKKGSTEIVKINNCEQQDNKTITDKLDSLINV